MGSYNGLDPEIIKIFKGINDKLTEAQIEFIVDSLKPKPKKIFGQIINMLYLEDDNLASLIIQSNALGNIFTLSANPADPDINAKFNEIQIDNLNIFRNRLQEAFNYQSLVNIYHENNEIKSLVLVARQTQEQITLFSGPGGGSSGAYCRYGKPPCD
ncbi:MAG: hypothetical protein AAGF26_16120 [Cyanobacteria bacterium P01_G01_bin.49]